MLEDMLRTCIIDFGGSWDDYLPLAEFSYDNSYHSSIGMPPYEMLYGWKCRTPVLRRNRQNSYVDEHRMTIEFQVEDFVELKVFPWKGSVAYRLELPEELNGIHDTFHVSYLRKCLADESAYVPLEDLEIDDKLNYVESR
ncbi:hypothetical protein E3N88_20951 [Mikania micrantha]|uniref:Tf2-1-like SH3-like domain-containing protein n=1 Tax=Mikania micrantha TaxID=192012 RepID=A0A5N6NLA1_9ASTR|nr:hypothetical protein E3N88_20951 [Mikania micrantha]